MNPASIALWSTKALVFALALVLAYEGKLTAAEGTVLASTLLTLGVTNAATLISQTRVLGTLIHQFVPGEGTPAAAAIARSAPPPAPPTPPAAVVAGALAFGLSAIVIAACAGAGPVSPTDVYVLGQQLEHCLQPDASIATQEACVHRVNALYCAQDGGAWRDAGVCQAMPIGDGAP